MTYSKQKIEMEKRGFTVHKRFKDACIVENSRGELAMSYLDPFNDTNLFGIALVDRHTLPIKKSSIRNRSFDPIFREIHQELRMAYKDYLKDHDLPTNNDK